MACTSIWPVTPWVPWNQPSPTLPGVRWVGSVGFKSLSPPISLRSLTGPAMYPVVEKFGKNAQCASSRLASTFSYCAAACIARGSFLRALEVEAEPLLDALHPGAGGQVPEQRQIQHDGRRQDRVPAEEIDLDLHRVAHPPDDVDVVPALFVVAAGLVVVDRHLVLQVLVEVRVLLRLEDLLQHRQLADLFGLEVRRIVEDFAVAVAEDVGGEPALHAQHARLESGR